MSADTRPECPFCNVGHLTMLGFLIICAYCKKAWQPFEFESDLYRLQSAPAAEVSTPHG